jgi:hypothetical protein
VETLCATFTDQFGRPIEPSAILTSPDAPASVDFEQVVAFRNSVAISSLIDARIFQTNGGSAGYPLWSDYFDFYPFTVTRDGDLGARSVAIQEIDLHGDFRGQKAPHLPTNDRLSFGLDQDVLDSCLVFWDRRFVRGCDERRTRRLFRSLEVAYLASRVPALGSRTPSIHDYGTSVALWVSAFEILSHRKEKNQKKASASLRTVHQLLGQYEWESDDLKEKRYRVKHHKNVYGANVIQKLYQYLYRARNAFLHGNAVRAEHLHPTGDTSARPLPHCAALIYRAALLAYTNIAARRVQGDFAAQVAAYMSAHRETTRYERAVSRFAPPTA